MNIDLIFLVYDATTGDSTLFSNFVEDALRYLFNKCRPDSSGIIFYLVEPEKDEYLFIDHKPYSALVDLKPFVMEN